MHLELMPDYDCWPLWRADRIDNVDPADLAISPPLRARLLEWANAYDATLNREDPALSGFASQDAEDAFDRAGRSIARDLQRELVGTATVAYWRDDA